jgi:hypothetical protein
MAITIPPGVDAEGRRTILWTPTQTLSVATLTGPTTIALTSYLSKNSFGIQAETEKGTDERECTKQVFQVLGKTTWTPTGPLEYVWDPQADTADPDNQAYETLVERTPGFFTLRLGLDDEVALAEGQKVWQWRGTVGPQVPKTPEGNAAEKLKIVQEYVIDGNVEKDLVLIV